jgi:hypothetical protein
MELKKSQGLGETGWIIDMFFWGENQKKLAAVSGWTPIIVPWDMR